MVTSVDLTDGTYVPAQICFERNGISSARDRVNFPRYLASLSGLIALGRVRTAPATQTPDAPTAD